MYSSSSTSTSIQILRAKESHVSDLLVRGVFDSLCSRLWGKGEMRAKLRVWLPLRSNSTVCNPPPSLQLKGELQANPLTYMRLESVVSATRSFCADRLS